MSQSPKRDPKSGSWIIGGGSGMTLVGIANHLPADYQHYASTIDYFAPMLSVIVREIYAFSASRVHKWWTMRERDKNINRLRQDLNIAKENRDQALADVNLSATQKKKLQDTCSKISTLIQEILTPP